MARHLAAALRDKSSRRLFLGLKTYNDVKKFVRRGNYAPGPFIDNGQKFLNLMTKVMQATPKNTALHAKWRDFQAENRAKRQAGSKIGRLSAVAATNITLATATATARTSTLKPAPSAAKRPAVQKDDSDIKVVYARTDNTTGYKEYGCCGAHE